MASQPWTCLLTGPAAKPPAALSPVSFEETVFPLSRTSKTTHPGPGALRAPLTGRLRPSTPTNPGRVPHLERNRRARSLGKSEGLKRNPRVEPLLRRPSGFLGSQALLHSDCS
nr:uncharacterized protein LOC110567351 [Aotus nancymaae]